MQMKKVLLLMMAMVLACITVKAQNEGEYAANYARAPRFKALLLWEPGAEEAHVQFDKQAMEFFHKLTYGEGWTMDVTTSLEEYPYERLKFLGCGQFYCNNWPPQPALVECDSPSHPVTLTLPREFVVPASEFYQWQPSPRLNDDVEVLLSISQKMYPFGLKDVVKFGDFPIVWTNKKYRMVYLNMGHGDEGFIDATQQLLFINAFRWLVSRDPQGDPFKK